MQKVKNTRLDIKSTTLTVVAFCIAPAIPSIIHFCIFIIFYPVRDTLWLVFLYGGISYFAMVVFGIPIYFIMKHYQMLNLRYCLSAGAIVAIIFTGFVFRQQLYQLPRIDEYETFRDFLGVVIYSLQGLFYGVVTGASFWAIAVHTTGRLRVEPR